MAALVPQQTFLFDDTVRGNVTLGATSPTTRCGPPSTSPRRRASSPRCRAGSTPGSVSGARRCRAVSASGSRWPGPSSAARSCSSSTTRPAPSTPRRAGHPPGPARVSAGTTVLVVAYRMSTITLADEIVYVERGRVVDHGTHRELLARCAGYERLVTAYAREAAERAAAAEGERDEEEHAEVDVPVTHRESSATSAAGSARLGDAASRVSTCRPELRRGIGSRSRSRPSPPSGRVVVPLVVQQTTDNGLLAPGRARTSRLVWQLRAAAPLIAVLVTAACRVWRERAPLPRVRGRAGDVAAPRLSGTSTTCPCSRRTPSAAGRWSAGSPPTSTRSASSCSSAASS